MQEAECINGVGLGLRGPHVSHILEHRPPVPWFEILADNYLGPGGLMWRQLEMVREHYPVTFHCVGMNLGGSDELDFDYLADLKRLAARYQGKRYSFGYPACPDLAGQRLLFELLQPEDIGVTLTDGDMMSPEASVSALVFHHPDARYFGV